MFRLERPLTGQVTKYKACYISCVRACVCVFLVARRPLKFVSSVAEPWRRVKLFQLCVLQRRTPDPKTQLNHGNEVRELENFSCPYRIPDARCSVRFSSWVDKRGVRLYSGGRICEREREIEVKGGSTGSKVECTRKVTSRRGGGGSRGAGGGSWSFG